MVSNYLPQSKTGSVIIGGACFVSGNVWLNRSATSFVFNGLSRQNCPIFSTVAERDYVRKLGVL